MNEHKLSKAEAKAIVALIEERRAASEVIDRVNVALEAQAAALRQELDLPEGRYDFIANQDGVVLRMFGGAKVTILPLPPGLMRR